MTADSGRGGTVCGRFFAMRGPDDAERCCTVPTLGSRSPKYAGGNHGRPGTCGLRPPGPRVARIVAVRPPRRLRRLRSGRISDGPQRSAVAPDPRALIAARDPGATRRRRRRAPRCGRTGLPSARRARRAVAWFRRRAPPGSSRARSDRRKRSCEWSASDRAWNRGGSHDFRQQKRGRYSAPSDVLAASDSRRALAKRLDPLRRLSLRQRFLEGLPGFARQRFKVRALRRSHRLVAGLPLIRIFLQSLLITGRLMLVAHTANKKQSSRHESP